MCPTDNSSFLFRLYHLFFLVLNSSLVSVLMLFELTKLDLRESPFLQDEVKKKDSDAERMSDEGLERTFVVYVKYPPVFLLHL